MNRRWLFPAVLCMVILLLSGCSMSTVEDLYCVPQRSQEYTNLQTVMEKAMTGLEYASPQSGEHQQVVQMADLNGDGMEEYLLFAKGSAEKPLKILIFSGDGESYELLDTIESNGTAFDHVEYIRMNDKAGYELVVGCQVSDQVLRSVSVYTVVGDQMECIMTDSYTKFLCADLSRDRLGDVFILKSGESEAGNGVGMLYSFENGAVERSHEVNMSSPADKIRRIMVGKLSGWETAVFVASDIAESAIITDVYAVVNDQLTNVSFSNDSGTSVQTLRNYYVYADDIDNDGILELPSLITMKNTEDSLTPERRYLIRWYAMTVDGSEVDKMYTYHNFVGGWYIELNGDIASRFSVTQKGNSYEFSLWDKRFKTSEKIMTVYVLTGQKREEQAIAGNRFVLHRGESVIYAADLEVASLAYNMDRDSLIASFHLILQDWKTGET